MATVLQTFSTQTSTRLRRVGWARDGHTTPNPRREAHSNLPTEGPQPSGSPSPEPSEEHIVLYCRPHSVLQAPCSRRLVSLAVYHPLMKRTGVCSLTKSEHRPSSDPDSTSTRPRLDLDPDMTRPDPGRDPKSSTDFTDLGVHPQISPAQDPNPRAPSRHQISLEIR